VIEHRYGIVGQNPFSVRKVRLLTLLEKGIKYDIKEKSHESKIIKISDYSLYLCISRCIMRNPCYQLNATDDNIVLHQEFWF